MNQPPLTGKLVRLTVADPEKDARLYLQWDQDSTFQRLLRLSPVRLVSAKKITAWWEEDLGSLTNYNFIIRTLKDDLPVGGLGLDDLDWVTGNAWVGIGIGEREYWGKGYGTDALNVLMRHAFHELNLRRLSLTVLDFNTRAISSYKKLGFREEGLEREALHRAGERCGLLYMGVFRDEWEAAQENLE
jgi:RimJ/RimL family protein N-acetyltransferase